MGSLGGSVARNVESRGIVSGQSVTQLANRVSSSTSTSTSTSEGGGTLAALTSAAVGAQPNPNSFFMANSIQAATQQRAVNDMIRHLNWG